MRNFNINLLSTAQTVIGKQAYQIRKPSGRTRNAAGYYTTAFGLPIDMTGSVQPVKATQYKLLDLDFKKTYIKIYDVGLIETIDRDKNSDQIIYDGFLWAVPEDTPWFMSGGWTFVLCVRLERFVP